MLRTCSRWLVLTSVAVGLAGLAPRESLAQAPALRFDPRLVPARLSLSAASAAVQAPTPRFKAPLVPAGAVLAGTVVTALIPSIYASRFPTATCAPCDPSHLNALDRGTVGQVRPGAGTASDAFLFATMGGAGLLAFTEAHGDWNVAREDLTVLAQSVATATLITSWLKVLVHRPRPFRYVPAETTITVQSGLSFPSGHSTGTWSAAFAYWSLQALRGRAHERAPRIALLLATAATCSVLRVVAHQHFPTDVMAGAVIGAGVGWFLPRLYPKQHSP